MTLARTILYENCDKTKPVIVNVGDPTDPSTWSYNTPDSQVWSGDPTTLGGIGGGGGGSGTESTTTLEPTKATSGKGGVMVHTTDGGTKTRWGITDDPVRVSAAAASNLSSNSFTNGAQIIVSNTEIVTVDVKDTCVRIYTEGGHTRERPFNGQIATRTRYSLVPVGSPPAFVDLLSGGGDQLIAFGVDEVPAGANDSAVGEYRHTDFGWSPPLAIGDYEFTVDVKMHNNGAISESFWTSTKLDGYAVVTRFIAD